MPFRSAPLLLAVFLAASFHSAYAQTGKTPETKTTAATLPIAPDRPGRWRQAVRDDPSKYRCLLGLPPTPLCALANRFSCEVIALRSSDEVGFGPDATRLCRNAYGEIPPQQNGSTFAGPYLQYRIERVRVATKHDIEAAARIEGWPNPYPPIEARPGDLLVSVYRRSCWEQPCPDPRTFLGYPREEPYDERAAYFLRQEGKRWRPIWSPYELPSAAQR